VSDRVFLLSPWQFRITAQTIPSSFSVDGEFTMRRAYLALFSLCLISLGLAVSAARPLSPPAVGPGPEVRANTFSVVGYDPLRKEWGVATASRVLAVGAAVPWARAGAGAVATQSLVNVSYGPKGLDLLAGGKSAEDTLKQLTGADDGKDHRQVGIVDAKGNVAHFSGKDCSAWFGAKAGKHYVCLGNLLKGEAVVEEMAKAYEGSKGPLAWRLLAALEAGEKAGGDKRGKQSAAVLVVRERGGPNGFGDRAVDLRVDDHEGPVQELARILAKQVRRPKQD
jgi:uncharacterized Ntn-hydrolase superfamily protein